MTDGQTEDDGVSVGRPGASAQAETYAPGGTSHRPTGASPRR
jgi:hypothetical protein